MERWKGWLYFNFKNSFLLPTKCILVKVTSRLRHKARENRHGLVSLYKDMEACAEYADIQVMWEMIHSSSPSSTPGTESSKRPSHHQFRFRTI
ncbi:hypothetical protein RJ639_037497 [Escallonia herrerae]|uniref:Uncharacterized protein n=1 Tax=Escallonia herrerae TaxID=1293975 RepID=A0AA89BEY1_9ASTE|nr:hypothetical protein RJ639_037497 [Escallonia herrerae]